MPTIQEQFGAIDIYLFDQILRGNVTPGMTIFDAGCGSGRNVHYFLREGYDVYGVDLDPRGLPAVRFRTERVESNSFPSAFADVVISSAVLHFARNDEQFRAMLYGSWSKLKPGGLFFCRLASSIGIESLVRPIDGRWHHLPDGSDRPGADLMRLDGDGKVVEWRCHYASDPTAWRP